MADRRALAALVMAVAAGCRAPRPGAPLTQPHATAPRPAPAPAATLTAALDAGDPAAILAAAAAAPAEAVAAARPAIARAIAALPDAALAAHAEALASDQPPRGAIALALADRARRAGDRAGRERWLAVAAASPDADAADRAALTARAAVDRAVIAVLLPLSGPHAAIGRELRAAIALAPPAGATPLWLDTGGDPAGAVRAVEAADAAGALLALGPVGVREAEAARQRAAELGLPLALLSPSDPPPAPGLWGLLDSPTTEAVDAAELAAALGVGTVAVLAPRDEVGAAAAAAFVAAATALDLTVVAQGDYALETRTLGADVKAFLGLDPTTNPRLAAHLRRFGKRGWQTFSPDIGFALLYLPDRYERAALVASFLPYYGVELHREDFPDLDALARKHGGRLPQVVQLVGSSSWHHPGLIARGGPAVEGALVIAPCPLDDGDPAATAFVDGFRAATRRDPSPAAAAAHDAWRLLEAARVGVGGRDLRASLDAALAGASLDDGACGPARVGPDRRIDRTPAVMKVDAGAFVREPM
jgi:ABC-type branched-subunit amino acid transport system substrate-binding protein